MVNKLKKDFYNTILSQSFSSCGNYLAVGDIYGTLSIFYLSKVLQAEGSLSKDELLPRTRITVTEGFPLSSLLSVKTHLLIGGLDKILAYTWKSLKSTKNPQVAWSIDIPNKRDAVDRTEVNCLLYDEDLQQLYAACGDNKIYVFDLETRSLIKALDKHKDYVHSILMIGNDLISCGEDGVVNIWDLRTGKVTNKIEPHLDERVQRPQLGKWIGAVGANEDYILCGGGPRLSLWHYRFLNNSTVFPIEDGGIYIAEIYKDKILAGGRAKFFYQMSYVGNIINEIPTSTVTTYSAVHNEEHNIMSLAGSSPKIDICSNFMYRNQQLSLY